MFVYQAARFSTSPGVPALNVLGGVSRSAIEAGEWWRVTAHALLHGNVEHVVSNVVSLLFIGWFVERAFGSRTTLLVMALGTFVGAVAGVIAYDVITVGASSALYALLGFAIAQHHPARSTRITMRIIAAVVLGLDVQLAVEEGISTYVSGEVNVAAHGGGIAAGVVVALMLRFLPVGAVRAAGKVALVAWAVGLASVGVALVPVLDDGPATWRQHSEGDVSSDFVERSITHVTFAGATAVDHADCEPAEDLEMTCDVRFVDTSDGATLLIDLDVEGLDLLVEEVDPD